MLLPGIACAEQPLPERLAEVVSREELPALYVSVIGPRGLHDSAAAGVRKWGTDTPATAGDKIHLGSCTKAMTAVMLATLVQDGHLRWETTLAEALPELRDTIHLSYHGATLWQLVNHRAHLPQNAADWWAHQDKPLMQRRRAILTENLKTAPGYAPPAFSYSNLGYLAAGCIAEAVTGKPWENLMRERVFDPLGMTSAGFGPPGKGKSLDQPWGHVIAHEEWKPVRHDNAEALGPAGRVHCTLADWARFLTLFFDDTTPTILTRDSRNKLMTPTGDYAGGWQVTQRDWANGTALTHSGSNTMWYATVWVAPATNRAYIAATNSCAPNSHKICDTVIADLIAHDTQ
jgi:CubicO group peptidase (beta-lactamase class C family)